MKENPIQAKMFFLEAHTRLTNEEFEERVRAAILADSVRDGAIEVRQTYVFTCQPPKD
ncbi:MAG: hypothetical protein L0229_20280 [Blastocatellia bacterium]|nr:hypothetical protein [Blastocatellia bacterium]